MSFYYQAGDIILLGNMEFLDDGSIDTHISKRPFIVLKDYSFVDECCFLLKLSTDKNIYQLDTRKFVTLLPDGKNKLKRKSYVDLRNVYKTDKNSARIIGYVPDHILRRLINKVNRIHNNDPKPYYEEYISSL